METTNYTRSRPVIVNEANMMFKRPIHNVLTGLGMLGVFFMGWWAWYVFGGSEKAEQRAIQAAKDYVEQTYSDPTLHVTDVMYLSLYDPNYHVRMASETSVDTDFTVRVTRGGKIVDDSYEEDVVSMFNTYWRIQEAYDRAVQDALRLVFSGRISLIGELPYARWDEDKDKVNKIDLDDLEVDQVTGLSFYGAQYGILFAHVKNKSYTYEEVADLLRYLKWEADDRNIRFHSIKLQITIDGIERYTEDIFYDDIDPPNFVDHLERLLNN